MLERHVLDFGARIDQRSVTLIERAAPRILPGKSHRRARNEERCKRERLGHAVIHGAFSVRHFRSLLEQLF